MPEVSSNKYVPGLLISYLKGLDGFKCLDQQASKTEKNNFAKERYLKLPPEEQAELFEKFYDDLSEDKKAEVSKGIIKHVTPISLSEPKEEATSYLSSFSGAVKSVFSGINNIIATSPAAQTAYGAISHPEVRNAFCDFAASKGIPLAVAFQLISMVAAYDDTRDSRVPSLSPSFKPTTSAPSVRPSPSPTTRAPSVIPSPLPTTGQPTSSPTRNPTSIPTQMPTIFKKDLITNSSRTNSSETLNSDATLAGYIVGGVLFVAIAGCIAYCCCCKGKPAAVGIDDKENYTGKKATGLKPSREKGIYNSV